MYMNGKITKFIYSSAYNAALCYLFIEVTNVLSTFADKFTYSSAYNASIMYHVTCLSKSPISYAHLVTNLYTVLHIMLALCYLFIEVTNILSTFGDNLYTVLHIMQAFCYLFIEVTNILSTFFGDFWTLRLRSNSSLMMAALCYLFIEVSNILSTFWWLLNSTITKQPYPYDGSIVLLVYRSHHYPKHIFWWLLNSKITKQPYPYDGNVILWLSPHSW